MSGFFDEVWTVWDGSVDQEWTVTGPAEFDAVVAEVDAEWRRSAPVVQLFTLRHAHGPEVAECECAQFVQDHRPVRVWGDES